MSQKSALTASLVQRRDKEFRGNLVLILAIALLVGVATFVLVREKVADERGEGSDGPAGSAGPKEE